MNIQKEIESLKEEHDRIAAHILGVIAGCAIVGVLVLIVSAI